jgi:hypothetical protein
MFIIVGHDTEHIWKLEHSASLGNLELVSMVMKKYPDFIHQGL